MKDNKNVDRIIYVMGFFIIIWLALLVAPYSSKGLIGIVKNSENIFNNMFKINFCENSIRTILIFLTIYFFTVILYESSRKNYRRKEEYGSAEWGNAVVINRKYKQKDNMNKLLTKNVAIGLKGKQHRRNVNVLVIGRFWSL